MPDLFHEVSTQKPWSVIVYLTFTKQASCIAQQHKAMLLKLRL